MSPCVGQCEHTRVHTLMPDNEMTPTIVQSTGRQCAKWLSMLPGKFPKVPASSTFDFRKGRNNHHNSKSSKHHSQCVPNVTRGQNVMHGIILDKTGDVNNRIIPAPIPEGPPPSSQGAGEFPQDARPTPTAPQLPRPESRERGQGVQLRVGGGGARGPRWPGSAGAHAAEGPAEVRAHERVEQRVQRRVAVGHAVRPGLERVGRVAARVPGARGAQRLKHQEQLDGAPARGEEQDHGRHQPRHLGPHSAGSLRQPLPLGWEEEDRLWAPPSYSPTAPLQTPTAPHPTVPTQRRTCRAPSAGAGRTAVRLRRRSMAP